MKKHRKPYWLQQILLTILLCLITSLIKLEAQSNGFCSTASTTHLEELCADKYRTGTEKGPFFLRIYVHVIRDDNGNGGQSQLNVEEALGYLDEAYNPHNIFFVWDCNIIPINHTGLFNVVDPTSGSWGGGPGADFFNDFDQNHDPNGIDIYLFPEHPSPNPAGSGNAGEIATTHFFVSGNYEFSPHGSRVRSHVMSHEMGHCLGLAHTHNTDQVGTTLPDNSNCTTTGDCVCDTPADPNLLGTVGEDCNWLGTGSPDDQFYNPSTSNIMSYSNDECLMEFTDDQGQRMRNIIADTEELQNCIAKEVISENETVVWNTVNSGSIVEIKGTLEIESGATLTIESGVEVRFGRKNKLIIKPNATLILEGTLTSNPCINTCTQTGYCGDTWKGVEVWGNTTETQFIENGQRAQGRFIGRGGLVENAEIAVQLWGENRFANSGGIITCANTQFKNNRIGINFFDYTNSYPDFFPESFQNKPVGYFARFTSCHFETDNNYPHEENFLSFVRLVAVSGPTFIGCSFINADTYVPVAASDEITAYGYGIYAYNSSFKVQAKCNSTTAPCTNYQRTTFAGLGYGVYTSDSANDTPYHFIVRQADFTSCYVGIHNRSVIGGTMLFNDFNLGDLPSTALTTEQIGIALSGSLSGMTIQENDFIHNGETPNVESTGINTFNIGSSNKVIRKNRFEGLKIGCEAGGICGSDIAGLLFECNTHIDNTEHDFLVFVSPFNPTVSRIKEAQSSVGNDGQIVATGNRFSNTGQSADRDFSNMGDQELRYFYKMNGGIDEIPDEYSGISQIIDAPLNSCPEDYCEPPCKTASEVALLKNKYYTEKDDYLITKEDYLQLLNSGDDLLAEQKKELASKQRQQLDKDAFIVLLHAMYDTVHWDIDTVRTWLSNMDDYGAEMMLLTSYVNTNELDEALSIGNNIAKKIDLTKEQLDDLANTKELLKLLKGHSVYNIPVHLLKDLEIIAHTKGEYASGRAKNILTYYGWHFPPVSSGDRNRFKTPETKNHKNTINDDALPRQLNVYPNPAKDQVVFEQKLPLTQNAYISVVDFTGKIYWHYALSDNEDRIEWLTGDIPNGLYFYQLISNGIAIDSGKIIIQK